MPPSLSKGGIRNEKGSGKAAANEPMRGAETQEDGGIDRPRSPCLARDVSRETSVRACEGAGLWVRSASSRFAEPGHAGSGLQAHGLGLAASGWGSRARAWGSRRTASGWAHGLRTRARGSRAARSRTSGCGLCPSGAAAIPRSARPPLPADGRCRCLEGTSLRRRRRRCRTRQAQGRPATSKGPSRNHGSRS